MNKTKRGHPITKLLLDLVAVRSDSGSKLERSMADRLMEIVLAQPYFCEHPECCGRYDTGDILGRPVVWALRKGSGNTTIVLTGHYDAVGIDSYGTLREFALDPDVLKEKMRAIYGGEPEWKDDLDDPDWLFGRGVADMKAGLAVNLHELFTNANEEVNLLFVAVPDEENMSAGARMAVGLYRELKERFSLDYKLAILSEPCFREVREKHLHVTLGTTGKLLPVVVAKGRLAHAARVMNGLNAALIVSRIVEKMEFNMDFVSHDMDKYTMPPTALIVRDLKPAYDVSLPEYAAASFNVLFLKNDRPSGVLARIRELCASALSETVAAYKKAFDELAARDIVPESQRVDYKPRVMSLDELSTFVIGTRPGAEREIDALKRTVVREVEEERLSLPDASIRYIKSLIELSQIAAPVVVFGISPPYYPPENALYVDEGIRAWLHDVDAAIREASAGEVEGLQEISYTSGMTDMSYMSCGDPVNERALMNNVTLPREIYDIDFETLAELNIPTVMIGPASKHVHQIGERVYLPDVERNLPALFEIVIDRVSKM